MRDFFSQLDEARYRVVHEFPGGAVRLAPLVGMRPGTLSNKVNPEVETHHLSVDEAIAIQHAARRADILLAEAALLGHACIPVDEGYQGVCDAELIHYYASMNSELGDVASEIDRALADGRFTRGEFEAVRREMYEAINAQMELLRRLEGLVDD